MRIQQYFQQEERQEPGHYIEASERGDDARLNALRGKSKLPQEQGEAVVLRERRERAKQERSKKRNLLGANEVEGIVECASVGEQRVRAEAEARATVDCTGERMPA